MKDLKSNIESGLKRKYLILFYFCLCINALYAQTPTVVKPNVVKSLVDSTKKTIAKSDSIKKVIAKLDTLRGTKLKSTIKGTKNSLAMAFGIKPYKPNEKPKVAFIRSLLVPGWGQITNKQYIKLPIVYGGAIVGGYYIYLNHNNYITYKEYLTEAFGKKKEIFIDNKGPYSLAIVTNAANQYRRWEQGTAIGVAVGWLLFAVEANVAAHLKSFDVSNDISFKIKPDFSQQNGYASSGIKLELNF